MIPFDSWDGRTDFSGTTEQSKLEQHFGNAAVAFNTYQSAVASILEVLGSRTHTVPVILPVTTAPDVLAGVLRAGADPVLLDIKASTLQLDPDMLRTVLEELKAAVVVMTRPTGQPVDPSLLEITGDLPTILDTRLLPHGDIDSASICTFSLFDLSPMVGSGAIVIHKFSEQVQELKMVRNGILGLSANLNDTLSQLALSRLREDSGLILRRQTQTHVAETYKRLCISKLKIPFPESTDWPYFTVEVANAGIAVAHLHPEISACQAVYPLHLSPHVARRWMEKPSYPVAEEMHQRLVALPTHLGIIGKEDMIVSKLLEVSNG